MYLLSATCNGQRLNGSIIGPWRDQIRGPGPHATEATDCQAKKWGPAPATSGEGRSDVPSLRIPTATHHCVITTSLIRVWPAAPARCPYAYDARPQGGGRLIQPARTHCGTMDGGFPRIDLLVLRQVTVDSAGGVTGASYYDASSRLLFFLFCSPSISRVKIEQPK